MELQNVIWVVLLKTGWTGASLPAENTIKWQWVAEIESEVCQAEELGRKNGYNLDWRRGRSEWLFWGIEFGMVRDATNWNRTHRRSTQFEGVPKCSFGHVEFGIQLEYWSSRERWEEIEIITKKYSPRNEWELKMETLQGKEQRTEILGMTTFKENRKKRL